MQNPRSVPALCAEAPRRLSHDPSICVLLYVSMRMHLPDQTRPALAGASIMARCCELAGAHDDWTTAIMVWLGARTSQQLLFFLGRASAHAILEMVHLFANLYSLPLTAKKPLSLRPNGRRPPILPVAETSTL